MKRCALLLFVACRGDAPKVTPAVAVNPPARVVREEVGATGDVQLYAGTIADLDGDGTLELAAAGFVKSPDKNRATVFVYRQVGAEWQPVTDGGWLGGGGGNGSLVRNVEIADLDGDGSPEVIALGRVGPRPDEAAARLVVLSLRDGVLHERAKAEWKGATYTQGFGLAVGDLDGDKRPEVVTSGFLFDGTTDHGFVRTWSFRSDALTLRAEAKLEGSLEASTRINDVTVADLDGDGHPEIVTVGRYGAYKLHGTNELQARREHGDIVVWDAQTLRIRAREDWIEGVSLRLRAVSIANLDGEGGPEIVVGGQFDSNGKACLGVFTYRDNALAYRAKTLGEVAGEIKDVVIADGRIIATGPIGAKPARQGDVTSWRYQDGKLVREQELVSSNAELETRTRGVVLAPDGQVMTVGFAKTSTKMIGQVLSWPLAAK